MLSKKVPYFELRMDKQLINKNDLPADLDVVLTPRFNSEALNTKLTSLSYSQSLSAGTKNSKTSSGKKPLEDPVKLCSITGTRDVAVNNDELQRKSTEPTSPSTPASPAKMSTFKNEDKSPLTLNQIESIDPLWLHTVADYQLQEVQLGDCDSPAKN